MSRVDVATNVKPPEMIFKRRISISFGDLSNFTPTILGHILSVRLVVASLTHHLLRVVVIVIAGFLFNEFL